MRKTNKFTVTSLADVGIELVEAYNDDRIYHLTFGNDTYAVSAHHDKKAKEVDVLLLEDSGNILIGFAKVSKSLETSVKQVVLSYLVGKSIVAVKTDFKQD